MLFDERVDLRSNLEEVVSFQFVWRFDFHRIARDNFYLDHGKIPLWSQSVYGFGIPISKDREPILLAPDRNDDFVATPYIATTRTTAANAIERAICRFMTGDDPAHG
jgi:hypothetical protein